MALFIRQNEDRSKLQERLSAELQERAKSNSGIETKSFDAEKDSTYLQGTKTTTSLAWVWALIFIFAAGLIIWLLATL